MTRRTDLRWFAGTALSGGLACLVVFAGSQGSFASRNAEETGTSSPSTYTVPGETAAVRRGDRPVTVAATPPPRDRVLRVSTVTREGDARVVRKKPFGYASAPLAIAAATSDYDPFDPLAIYSTARDDRMDATHAAIYDADVESEVTLQSVPFDPDAPFHPTTQSERIAKLEVARMRAQLGEADRAFAALDSKPTARIAKAGKGSKVDLNAAVAALDSVTGEPLARSTTALAYGPTDESLSLPSLAQASRLATDRAIPEQPAANGFAGLEAATLSAALTLGAENVSRVEQSGSGAWSAPVSREVVMTLKTHDAMLPALLEGLRTYGADRSFLSGVASSLGSHWKAHTDVAAARSAGPVVIRLAWQAPTDTSPAAEREVRRVSIYEGDAHLVTLARNDSGRVVEAPAPARIVVDAGEREKRRIALSRAMPTIYDGLMRAALSQGLTATHARRLVRTMAFDVDFRAKATPEDELEVFYSLSEDTDRPGDESQILYAAATIGGVTRRYYRFAHAGADGETVTDFYDETGKSAKKFLLRRPVPNGRLTSGYGMRRHPKLRYRKMHSGVDWAAPSGTPILSAGNGTVIKRGWAGGYGRQIKIRHANGYVTSYNHLRRYARGLKVGTRVRQGEPIGQVGTSGLSTGPHLHYEVSVNGRRVNPMRIRLPKGETLKGEALAAFERERDRVDALVKRGRGNVEVASN